MNFFEIFQMLGGNVWLYGGAFILVLSILVFVHEWGHYIIARMCGIRVETFSIGFGKELLGFNDKNGTRWKIAMIPLGGYVKLFGDVDPASASHEDTVEEAGDIRPMSETEKKEAFFSQPVWKRAAIVIAGPAINYIFAIILLAGLFIFNGQPITPPVAAAVIKDSSANEHGFLPHDKILSIDGKSVDTFEDVRREMMIALDVEKHFVVERGGEAVDIYAKPRKVVEKDRFGFEHSRGLLGLISPRHAVKIDNIIRIDGQSFEDGSIEDIRKALLSRLDTTFEIEVNLGDENDVLLVQPMTANNLFIKEPGAPESDLLFISNTDANVFVKYGFFKAVGESFRQTWVVTRGTVEALGQMVTGTRSATELGGIIRIGALAGDMAKQGLIALIMFTALLSINLGLINLFPIPMLDGGHLLFYAIEAVMGRPVPEQIQEYAFRIGLVFLVGVMVFANLNDLIQLVL
ncbi:MAG: RIP metalloprotease RseP [Alphaproteobacteria bacterium]|nr:RIP metalloprotease RseP [Alphaproteobacteria bacterium]